MDGRITTGAQEEDRRKCGVFSAGNELSVSRLRSCDGKKKVREGEGDRQALVDDVLMQTGYIEYATGVICLFTRGYKVTRQTDRSEEKD